MKPIRVLIVDDSASVRTILSEIVDAEPDLQVMATASNPYFAAERMREEVPDVIICDIEMPRMDGITFVQKLMSQRPIPVVICSSLAEAGSQMAMQALDAGAVEIITKPRVGTPQFLMEAKTRICDAVRAASKAKVQPRTRTIDPQKKLTADAVLPALSGRPIDRTTDKVVVVGASTGGTEALRKLLEVLPADSPGIVIVQHMPAGFTTAFAKRLDTLCRIEVREAVTGDRVVPGLALIAPGNFHLLLQRSGAQYHVEVREGPLVTRHRPSVDVLFRSASRAAGANALGIIMTGMGDDGAKGMLELRQTGARTLGQDEASCVVYGMPKEAMKIGAVELELPLQKLPAEILRFARDHALKPAAGK
ncbi:MULTISPECIES: protein-glutamate methylesterase/protein-glutamine glutaminase [unclassified Aureimonas]|uniref:protein-glutamate methylesterase/protein-glutamine glutaminase n=1 Tax=unclassified Aureimonas TaxID=2615206 RepID=UPI0006FFA5E7|nr:MULTISPECIES: chemotaxis response regulator protein-glutamate methylesterase [unclassified Aureimonas]KQT69017.1 two-component system response regulator protein-glutamate methylesterase [Aureimonas sp. Leaf460]KQT69251.1 two-component system response regulator protein-glutamate methylesterase [Aureimonas sp. Leaf427]